LKRKPILREYHQPDLREIKKEVETRNEISRPAERTLYAKQYTLRNHPQSHYYKFLGECYLHGVMNGEAIKWQNQENIPSQSFELR